VDPTKTVTVPGTGVVYFRTNAILIFNAGVPDQAKQAIFSQYGLTVLGVTPGGTFHVKFADPGTSIAALEAFLATLRARPELRTVGPWIGRGVYEKIDGRFPSDSMKRSDWFASGALQSGLWAMKAIRAPQAWGCETGMYDGSPTIPVGLLEFVHDSTHPELVSSRVLTWLPSDSELTGAADTAPSTKRPALRLHSANTGGILTAIGDDGKGIAGVAWHTAFQQYSFWSPARRLLPHTGFHILASAIRAGHPRVLSVSMGYTGDTLSPIVRLGIIDDLEGSLRQFLLVDVPDLLVVAAAGNDQYRGTAAGSLPPPSVCNWNRTRGY
jgi:hypothetical protein